MGEHQTYFIQTNNQWVSLMKGDGTSGKRIWKWLRTMCPVNINLPEQQSSRPHDSRKFFAKLSNFEMALRMATIYPQNQNLAKWNMRTEFPVCLSVQCPHSNSLHLANLWQSSIQLQSQNAIMQLIKSHQGVFRKHAKGTVPLFPFPRVLFPL